jgi:hypothetical protein
VITRRETYDDLIRNEDPRPDWRTK